MTATPSVELETLRESQDRALHREGIPMFVALVDERGSPIPEPGPELKAGGARVAARIEEFRRALGPNQRDTDMGFAISVLTVAAYEDFNRSVTP